MKLLVVWQNHFRGQILYRPSNPSKKRRQTCNSSSVSHCPSSLSVTGFRIWSSVFKSAQLRSSSNRCISSAQFGVGRTVTFEPTPRTIFWVFLTKISTKGKFEFWSNYEFLAYIWNFQNQEFIFWRNKYV